MNFKTDIPGIFKTLLNIEKQFGIGYFHCSVSFKTLNGQCSKNKRNKTANGSFPWNLRKTAQS